MNRDIRSKNRYHCYRPCSRLVIKSYIKARWSISLLSSFPPTYRSILTPLLTSLELVDLKALCSMLSFLFHTFFVCRDGDKWTSWCCASFTYTFAQGASFLTDPTKKRAKNSTSWSPSRIWSGYFLSFLFYLFFPILVSFLRHQSSWSLTYRQHNNSPDTTTFDWPYSWRSTFVRWHFFSNSRIPPPPKRRTSTVSIHHHNTTG